MVQPIEAKIETLLRQKIGLDANSIGSKTIARAVDRCRGSIPLAAYWQRLQTSSQELKALIEAIVVPETWFFRDREPFIWLSRALKAEPVLQTPKLRILSVPCSTGEEPYSIAMTLFDAGLAAAQFQIDAIDISQHAIIKAKQAVYTKKSFRAGFQPGDRYFQPTSTGYEVRSFVRETVNFMLGNIVQPAILKSSLYHVIFCRNLLIYLDSAARTQVLQTLDRSLSRSGILIVGAAETAQISSQHYTPLNHSGAFAYRKTDRAAIPVSTLKIPPRLPSLIPSTKPMTIEQIKQLVKQGQLVEAAAQCETYLMSDRTNVQAYILLGEIYQDLNDLDRAQQAYQKAIYLNPNLYEALIHLALLKEQKGDIAGAAVLRLRVQRLLNS